MKLKWFSLGFVSAIILLYLISAIKNRPQNAADTWPKDEKEAMLSLMPWLKSARAAKVGKFSILAPADSSIQQAIISPTKGFPQILISENQIDFADSNHRLLSLIYSPSTGQLINYSFSTDMTKNAETVFDSKLSGEYDIKIDFPNKQNMVKIDNTWQPIVIKNSKKYIFINGVQKEILLNKDYQWKFTEQ